MRDHGNNDNTLYLAGGWHGIVNGIVERNEVDFAQGLPYRCPIVSVWGGALECR